MSHDRKKIEGYYKQYINQDHQISIEQRVEVIGRFTLNRQDLKSAEINKEYQVHKWKSSKVSGKFDLVTKKFICDPGIREEISIESVEHQANCHLLYFIEGYDVQVVQRYEYKTFFDVD